MKATERLSLMHQISKKLAGEEWNIINLTLEQFHLPVTKTSRLGPSNYILKQIKKAEDDILVDLAHHLEIPLPKAVLTGAPLFWKENTLRLFISHLAIKKETATALRDELEQNGISAFVAHNDITPSKEWQQEIEIALNTCDGLVALMEEGFHKSFWTDHEVGYVFGRGMPVIPVNMGESPYGFLAKFQAYKFHDIQKLADTIFKVLVNDARTSQKMSVALISQFERSKSFATASQNLKLLRKIRYWDNSLMERLKLAVRKNNQIKGSFDVPEGVIKLLKKVKSEMKQKA